jgi:hypothetical protein
MLERMRQGLPPKSIPVVMRFRALAHGRRGLKKEHSRGFEHYISTMFSINSIVTPGTPITADTPIESKLTGRTAFVIELVMFTRDSAAIPQKEPVIAFLIGFFDLIAICKNTSNTNTIKAIRHAIEFDIFAPHLKIFT